MDSAEEKIFHDSKQLLDACIEKVNEKQSGVSGGNVALYPTLIVMLGEKSKAYTKYVKDTLDDNWNNSRYLKYVYLEKKGDDWCSYILANNDRRKDIVWERTDKNTEEVISRAVIDMLEEDEKIDIVSCFSTYTDAKLTPWEIQDMTELNYLRGNNQNDLFPLVLRSRLVAAGHNIALRKSFLPKLPQWEDFLYDSWIIRSAAAANLLKFIPQRLTLHRIHGGNLTVSPEFSVKSSLAQQIRRNGTNELTKLRNEWALFRKNISLSPLFNEIPEANQKMLEQYISYLEKRLSCRRKNLVMRLILCLLMLPDYFRFGNKFRSAARDIAGL